MNERRIVSTVLSFDNSCIFYTFSENLAWCNIFSLITDIFLHCYKESRRALCSFCTTCPRQIIHNHLHTRSCVDQIKRWSDVMVGKVLYEKPGYRPARVTHFPLGLLSVSCFIQTPACTYTYYPTTMKAGRVHLCRVAGNTVWSHMESDVRQLWDGSPINSYTLLYPFTLLLHRVQKKRPP